MVKIPESIANYFKILQLSFAETGIWPAAWGLKLALSKVIWKHILLPYNKPIHINYLFEKSFGFFLPSFC